MRNIIIFSLALIFMTIPFLGCSKNPSDSTDNSARELMLVYSCDADGDGDIYIQNPIGATPLKLTDNDCDDWDPFLSPNCDMIVYETMCNWVTCPCLYTMGIEGENSQFLIFDGHASEGCFNMEDGVGIAYYSNNWGTYMYLYTISNDGENKYRVIDEMTHSFPSGLSWYGNWIAFCDYEGGISLYDFQDGTVTQITEDGQWPAFSPDGSQIAFVNHNDIFIINRDGSNEIQIDIERYFIGDLTWSPDGKYIFYGHYSGINKINVETEVDSTVLDDYEYYPSVHYSHPSVGYATN